MSGSVSSYTVADGLVRAHYRGAVRGQWVDAGRGGCAAEASAAIRRQQSSPAACEADSLIACPAIAPPQLMPGFAAFLERCILEHSANIARGDRQPQTPPRLLRAPTLSVARALIGMHLVHRHGARCARGRIVETEAYLGPRDLAAHSARGRTRAHRSDVRAARARVRLFHLRVLELPERGDRCSWRAARRAGARARAARAACASAPAGPGLLCRALRIDRRLNGADLRGQVLWLEPPPPGTPAARIGRATRVGVAYAGEWALRPWRFFDRDSPCVSTAVPRGRYLPKLHSGPVR